MQGNGLLGTVVVVLILGVVGGLLAYRPNTIRRLFGKDEPPGNEAQVQVERDKLLNRAKKVRREMNAAEQDYRRLESELAPTLKRSLDNIMKLEALQLTDYPGLWHDAKKPPEEDLLAEFRSLRDRVEEARHDLANGGNPKDWESLIDDGQKKSQELADDTKRRRDAFESIKAVFVKVDE
jgi:hypothetical protein